MARRKRDTDHGHLHRVPASMTLADRVRRALLQRRLRSEAPDHEFYIVRVHHEPGEQLWAEVDELPGLFATGTDMDDLRQALEEAIGFYLTEDGEPRHVELEDAGSVTEHRMLLRSA